MSTTIKNTSILLAAFFTTVIAFLFIVVGFELFPQWLKSIHLLLVIFTLVIWYCCYRLRTRSIGKKLLSLTRALLIVVISLLLVHFLLNILNIYQYEPLPTWFFSLKLFRFISLSSLFWTQFIFLLLGMIYFFSLRELRLQHSFLVIIVGLILLVPSIAQLQRVISLTYTQAIQMSVNLSTSYDERFTYRGGGSSYYGWIWPYSQFLIRHTPETSVIAVPPQSNVWKMEGNLWYFRWFMYPRTLIHLTSDNIPDGVTHLIIALGECDNGACGWPKNPIPKEKVASIILIDRETHQEVTLTDVPYQLDTDTYKWGIIELQK